MNEKVFWCKSCLNMSTRPRIEFNDDQICNACQWAEEKESFDFSKRQKTLKEALDKYRNPEGFDCIVPVSGGKDGSYVSYKLKEEYDMNPLTVTIRPALELDLGSKNLTNFINSGFNHIHVTPDPDVMQALNKYGFIYKGFPYYGWLITIHTAVIRMATSLGISLLFYGEDGEIEYGGSTDHKNKAFYGIDYMKSVYLEGGYEKVLDKVKNDYGFTEGQMYFWKFPENDDIKSKDLKFTHWSFYEPWDPYRNYTVAKEHCGLEEKEFTNPGTFTNFAQNDQALYALHAYLMYLKFGFGRATQDAGIEIRRGAMSRDQALNLVKLYDNNYPEEFEEDYLEYYDMSKEEFDTVLAKWANKDLFELKNGRWSPKFEVDEPFEI